MDAVAPIKFDVNTVPTPHSKQVVVVEAKADPTYSPTSLAGKTDLFFGGINDTYLGNPERARMEGSGSTTYFFRTPDRTINPEPAGSLYEASGKLLPELSTQPDFDIVAKTETINRRI
ncbi:hypothetical protein ISS07_00135 [Candidatus Woesearchaeota archaeon]|nr:hypothetical protein [Candidatus Woesearchaeota archaeon]